MSLGARQRVAIFGGSFDPPHVGHILGAAYLRLVAGFERVVVLPVGAHPFGKPLTAFEARRELCQLAFGELLGVEVCDIEAQLPKPNYTYATLVALHDQHPDWDMRLVVGTDVLLEKSQWQAFDEICKMAPLFVLARQGVGPPLALSEGDESRPPYPILPAISSTEIRAWLRSSRRGARPEVLATVLGPRLLQAIDRLGLYSNP